MNLSAPFTGIHFKFLGEEGGGCVKRTGEVGERVNALKTKLFSCGYKERGRQLMLLKSNLG